jgi:hypothetical protein
MLPRFSPRNPFDILWGQIAAKHCNARSWHKHVSRKISYVESDNYDSTVFDYMLAFIFAIEYARRYE